MKLKKIKSNHFFSLVDEINEEVKEIKDENSKVRIWLEKMRTLCADFLTHPYTHSHTQGKFGFGEPTQTFGDTCSKKQAKIKKRR